MFHRAAATLVGIALSGSACSEPYYPNVGSAGDGRGGIGGGGGGGGVDGGGGGGAVGDGGGVGNGRQFTRVFGGTGSGAVLSLATDSTGAIAVLGTFSGAINPGDTTQSALGSGKGKTAYLARYDSGGALRWARALSAQDSAPLDLQALAVAPAGDIVVAGACTGTVDLGGGPLTGVGPGSDSDVCLARYRGDGAHLFSRRLGDSAAQAARALALDTQGAIYVAGSLAGAMTVDGTTLRSAGGSDVFLLKLDATGKLLFGQVSGDGAEQEARALAADGEGGVVMAGTFQGTLTLAVGAAPLLSLSQQPALFLGRLGPDGALRWQRSYAAPFGALARRGGVTALAGPLAVGVDFGGGPLPIPSAGAYLVALDDSGKVLQQRTLGGNSAAVTASGLGIDGAGRLLLGGRFSGTLDLGGAALTAPAGLTQPFLVRLSPDGALHHARAYPINSPTDVQVGALAVDSGGAALLAGSLHGTVSFAAGRTSTSASQVPYLTRPDQ